jgi:type I restriction enzyme S subunit
MKSPWPSVPLAEVLAERQESPSDEDLASGEVRIVAKIGFNDGQIHLRSGVQTRTGMILIRPGDLVLSGINAAKGAIAVYGQEHNGSIAATIHYGAYIPNRKRVDVRYLWWLLRSETFRDLLREHIPGGIKTELKAKRLLPIPIPLPPLNEQRRIVTRIEELAALMEEAQGLRVKAREEAARLVAHTVSELFTAHRHSGWTRFRLDELVTEVRYGTSEKAHDEPSGTPILRMGNIQGGRLDLTDLKYLYISDRDRENLLLRPGDVLVNRTNSAELVGKCAVFEEGSDYTFASYLIRLRFDSTRADARLIAAYINSPIGRAYMFSKRKQMTGQANVNSKTLRVMPVSLPSIEEQRRIVAYLDGLQAQANELTALQAATQAELGALLPSVLDRAFRGEL